MPLIKKPFELQIAAALGNLNPDLSSDAKADIEKVAADLATAIDAYIKTATVTVPIVTVVATTGTAVAQAGAGTGSGVGVIT